MTASLHVIVSDLLGQRQFEYHGAFKADRNDFLVQRAKSPVFLGRFAQFFEVAFSEVSNGAQIVVEIFVFVDFQLLDTHNGASLLFAILRHRNTLTYLFTYLHGRSCTSLISIRLKSYCSLPFRGESRFRHLLVMSKERGTKNMFSSFH